MLWQHELAQDTCVTAACLMRQWCTVLSTCHLLLPFQEEEERQKEVSQMQASLEQMQAANEEHRQKQQDAEARLAALKVMLDTSVR